MEDYQKLSYIIHKLCYDNRYNQNTLLKCIPALIHHARRSDLRGLLELLNSTHDTELQDKIFSILSAYLVSNDEYIDAIITFNPIYDKIQTVLSGGQPRKTTLVLNFLSAILYVDQDNDITRKKSLAMYARNMIRVSGCLAIISDIFANCMVYQDTWKSLCRCLSEICRDSEINQSYCTHLIPMSIQRCIQGNEYVFLVLQNLIQNHERNIQLFLESNGVALFSRDLLQYDVCLQLLNTLVQNSSAATMLLSKTNLMKQLSDFIRLYGPNAQKGQWASVILYHLDSQIKEVNNGLSKKSNCDATKNINKAHEVSPSCVINNDLQISKFDNTVNLLNNVMKEVFIWNSTNKYGKEQTGAKRAFVQQTDNTRHDSTLSVENMQFKIGQCTQNLKRSAKKAQNLNAQEMSFSFLQKYSSGTTLHKTNPISQPKYIKSQISDVTSIKYDETNRTKYATISKVGNIQKNMNMLHQTFVEIDEVHNQSAVSSIQFMPKFVSTPKKNEKDKTSKSRISYLSRATFKAKKISKTKTSHENTTVSKDIKHRSFSNRLLGAINQSCTTFVKTVKNIFKNKTNHSIPANTNTENVPSCTYSFTDYMRKRDAILEDDSRVGAKNEEFHEFGTETRSCTTCNDTINLKHKFANDQYLRHTVKKLKLGINVYGCDFKKISRTFWPQNAYMTPAILYNLYRKLLIK